MNNEIARANKNTHFKAPSKKAEKAQECLKVLEEVYKKVHVRERELATAAGVDIEAHFKQPDGVDEEVIITWPRPYVIFAPTRYEVDFKEEKDGVTLTVIRLTTEYAESRPTGTRNLAIPAHAFYACKSASEALDRVYSDDKNKKKQEQKPVEEPAEVVPESGMTPDEVLAMDDQEEGKPTIAVSLDDLAVATEETKDQTQEGDQDSDDDNEWPVPKKEAETALLLYFDNASKSEMSISATIRGKDGQPLSNMGYPRGAIENKLPKNRHELWFVCHKIDPSQPWGEYEVEWSTEAQQSQVNYNVHYSNEYFDSMVDSAGDFYGVL